MKCLSFPLSPSVFEMWLNRLKQSVPAKSLASTVTMAGINLKELNLDCSYASGICVEAGNRLLPAKYQHYFHCPPI